MGRIIVKRSIDAPVDRVFAVVADISRFREAVPHITKIEFLSEQRTGVGTRFRETRLMHGKEASTELEVTEYEPDRSIRLVADSHGCVWDTLFETTEKDGGTELTMTMDSRPYKLLARIMTPLIGGMIQKGVTADLECVKEFCESEGAS